MTPLVSVLIPVFNRQEVLKECVSSVSNQTYKNLEIILIDDGSEDNSSVICHSLAQSNPKIKFFETKHCGVSSARNKGLELASGEYIFFVDSDDIIHPTLLADLMEGIISTDAAIAGCYVQSIANGNWTNATQKLMADNTKAQWIYKPYKDAFDDFMCAASPLGNLGSLVISRNLIGKTKFRTDLFIGEDFYFIYENMLKGPNCIFINEKRYFARIHSDNISNVFDFKGFYTRFYRRKLVWENEEALGRTKYANIQKRDAFGRFTVCMKQNKPYGKEALLMRKTMHRNRKPMFKAFTAKQKLLFILSVYMPITKSVLLKNK